MSQSELNISRIVQGQLEWMNRSYFYRGELLTRFWSQLRRQPQWRELIHQLDGGLHTEATLHSLLQAQLRNVESTFAEPLVLSGITGERNTLSCTGKGLVLLRITSQTSVAAALLAFQGALLTGNALLVQTDLKWSALFSLLENQLEQVIPDLCLIQQLALTQQESVLQHPDLAAVVYLGQEPDSRVLNRLLALRVTSIISPMVESDALNLSLVAGIDYLFGLVTERTQTINLTAIGGNTSLMEQGASRY